MEKRFEDQKEFTEKRFEDINKRFDDVNKRFEDQNQYMNKRFNALQWTMGIGFTIFSGMMITIMGLLVTILSSI